MTFLPIRSFLVPAIISVDADFADRLEFRSGYFDRSVQECLGDRQILPFGVRYGLEENFLSDDLSVLFDFVPDIVHRLLLLPAV